MIRMFLFIYLDKLELMGWIAASVKVAHNFQHGKHMAKHLWWWTCSFIGDHDELPKNLYGCWNVSMLAGGELAKEIHAHLQSIGKYVKALDIMHFLDTPNIKECYQLKKTISLATAQRWMHMMDYRWTKEPSGQYGRILLHTGRQSSCPQWLN
jgi:hypothetical protein